MNIENRWRKKKPLMTSQAPKIKYVKYIQRLYKTPIPSPSLPFVNDDVSK